MMDGRAVEGGYCPGGEANQPNLLCLCLNTGNVARVQLSKYDAEDAQKIKVWSEQ